MQNYCVFSVQDEFAEIDFGDKRLNSRFEKIINELSRQPSKSFPEATSSAAALEATYRLINNPRVTPEKILSPHVESTIQRAYDFKSRVVVAHDTTALILPGKSRADIGWVNQGGCGFLAHFSLAIARSQTPTALGVLGIHPFFRNGKAKGINPKRGKKNRTSSNESLRWWNAIHQTQHLFPVGVDPIHVADREADDYSLFAEMIANDIRFVIRVRQNRASCQLEGKEKKEKLFDLLDTLSVITQREVPLSKRGTGSFPNNRKTNQPRNVRMATLHISACSLTLQRSQFQYSDLPKNLTLNCVHVYEINAPADAEPVDWKLFTKEAIATEDDVLNVVDDYRARWIIEEYFKALKTGCAYEKRQLENKKSLLNSLAIFAPIAWQLLVLKSARQEPQASRLASEVLTKEQIEVLRAIHSKPLPEPLLIKDALLAIAAEGGHIRNNGPPGWQVINRGLQKIITMEVAWVIAKKM